jgi:hypothetical protein
MDADGRGAFVSGIQDGIPLCSRTFRRKYIPFCKMRKTIERKYAAAAIGRITDARSNRNPRRAILSRSAMTQIRKSRENRRVELSPSPRNFEPAYLCISSLIHFRFGHCSQFPCCEPMCTNCSKSEVIT